jgi:hypothetical protein
MLQTRQMLGDSWPRSAHEISEVRLADRDSQKCATGIRDPEVGTQFQKRKADTLVQTEAQEAGSSQK